MSTLNQIIQIIQAIDNCNSYIRIDGDKDDGLGFRIIAMCVCDDAGKDAALRLVTNAGVNAYYEFKLIEF